MKKRHVTASIPACTAFEVRNLSVEYSGAPALSGVSFAVPEHEFLCIIGPNGGGKSTLIKAALGLIPHYSGSIRLFGKPASQSKGSAGYVPQSSSVDRLFPITVEEVVLSGIPGPSMRPFRKFGADEKKRADYTLSRVGIRHCAKRRIRELSGGEFQRMLIARALVSDPDILFLDEPTASVDARSRSQIFSLLGELRASKTIILVTHDLLAVSVHAGAIACLNRRLVYHGAAELSAEVVEELYGCPVDLIAHGLPHRVLKEHSHE
jgi:zinc transport system ATP-binding protein